MRQPSARISRSAAVRFWKKRWMHEVADLIVEGGLRRDRERDDTPVDAVGAVALGRILVADVGVAAEDLLAGSGLLAGGAVTGLVGEDAGAEGSVVGGSAHLREGFGDMGRNLARTAREVIGLDPLGGAHIFRATAAQRELTELERVGTIAGGLARRWMTAASSTSMFSSIGYIVGQSLMFGP